LHEFEFFSDIDYLTLLNYNLYHKPFYITEYYCTPYYKLVAGN